MMVTLEEIVSKTTDLPVMPAAAVKVMQEADSSESSAISVAGTLAQDQSLSVRVLRLANSAYFGLSRQIAELSEAVVVLGMRNVRNLAVVASTYPWLSKPLKGYALGPAELWRHSFGVAIGAQLAARKAKLPNEDTAFTAGLICDLGKVALSVWLENKIVALLEMAARDGLSFDEAERLFLGFDHGQVGGHLAERWNLPQTIIEAITYHHRPSDCPTSNLIVDCTHLGDRIATEMGLSAGKDQLRTAFSEDTLLRLRMTNEDIEDLKDGFASAYERYEAMFDQLRAA